MVDLPRNGYVQPVEGLSGGAAIPVDVTKVTQIQNVETVTPLGAGASIVGASRDCIDYESFGISVFLDPLAGQAINATVLVENSYDNATWRQVDSVTLTGSTNENVYLNRVYSMTRRYYRATITNNDGAHAMTGTELISIQKPI